VTKWDLAKGVRGGQRVRSGTAIQLELGMYFVRDKQLYYVVDLEHDTHNFLIENCASLARQWHDAEELEQESIMIVGRG